VSLEQTGAERQWTVATASSLDAAAVRRGTAGHWTDVDKALMR